MKPADTIQVPIDIVIDMLLSGEITLDELTEEQISQIPDSVKKASK
jgi:hypothetical protein